MATTNQLWKMTKCVDERSSEACLSLQSLDTLVSQCETLVTAVETNNLLLENSPTTAQLVYNTSWDPASGSPVNAYNFNGFVIIPASWERNANPQDNTILTVPVGFRPPVDMLFSLTLRTVAGGFISPVLLRLESATGNLVITNGVAYPVGGFTTFTIAYTL